MRRWIVLCLALGCTTNPPPQYYPGDPAQPAYGGQPQPGFAPPDITKAGRLDDRMVDYKFDGGQLDFEMYRLGTRIVQTVRNRYAVGVMVAWTVANVENLQPV